MKSRIFSSAMESTPATSSRSSAPIGWPRAMMLVLMNAVSVSATASGSIRCSA
jgi:hypothetical protein